MVPGGWIRASEVQAYSYCARSWWLRFKLGLEPEDQGPLIAGTDRHLVQGRRVLRAAGFQRLAIVVLLMALLLAIVAIIWLLRGA